MKEVDMLVRIFVLGFVGGVIYGWVTQCAGVSTYVNCGVDEMKLIKGILIFLALFLFVFSDTILHKLERDQTTSADPLELQRLIDNAPVEDDHGR